MKSRKSLALLIGIMTAIVAFVTGFTIILLYEVGLESTRKQLSGTAISLVRILETVHARGWFAQGEQGPTDDLKMVIDLVQSAQLKFNTFSKTGELHLGFFNKSENKVLIFSNHGGFKFPNRVPLERLNGTAIYQAVKGLSGSMIGKDTHDMEVLAAYQAMPELQMGLVAKINLDEIRAPFIQAGIIALLFAVASVVLGAALFIRITSPILRRLEESEARYRDVVSSSSDWIWEMDADFRYTYLSENHKERLAIPVLERIGLTHFQLQTEEEDPEKWENHKQELFAHRPFRDFEYTYQSKGEHKVITRTSGTPVFDAAGNFKGYRGAGRDVTELVEAEEEIRRREELWKTFTDAATENLTVFDADLKVVDINQNCLTMVGMEKKQAVGRHVSEFQNLPAATARIQKYLEVLKTGKPVSITGLVNHARLGERILEFKAFPVGKGMGLISTDITERTKVERMKNEFVSVVSHELKTPLTAIMGALQVLTAGHAGSLDDRAREMVDIAIKNSERLTILISDILDVEKIASGRMKFEMKPLKVELLASHAVNTNQTLAEPGGISFQISQEKCNAMVLGDYDRLMQVFSNLLSNAVKFSPKKGRIEVGVSRENGHVRVAVSDQGEGIPASFNDRIFEKFSQADSSDTRPKGGAGLGLNICKSIVEMHGGTIGFESAQPEGTTFFFTIPEWREPGQSET